MAVSDTRRFRNLLLNLLPSQELKSLSAQFEFVDLPRRTQLELPRRTVEHVYFMESGIVSIVADGKHDVQVEIGIIGREGMTGLAVVHDTDRSPYSSYMQVEGTGNRIAMDAVRDAMKRDSNCNRVFANFAHAFTIQISETAVANARANIEERLARWLLMAQDRVGSKTLPLTHEFLSLMMGARRPGVTEAIHKLAQEGLLTHTRGTIEILDRKGLEAQAKQYYGVPEDEYRRLFSKFL